LILKSVALVTPSSNVLVNFEGRESQIWRPKTHFRKLINLDDILNLIAMRFLQFRALKSNNMDEFSCFVSSSFSLAVT